MRTEWVSVLKAEWRGVRRSAATLTRERFICIYVLVLVAYSYEVPKKLQVEEGISKALNIANRGPILLLGQRPSWGAAWRDCHGKARAWWRGCHGNTRACAAAKGCPTSAAENCHDLREAHYYASSEGPVGVGAMP